MLGIFHLLVDFKDLIKALLIESLTDKLDSMFCGNAGI